MRRVHPRISVQDCQNRGRRVEAGGLSPAGASEREDCAAESGGARRAPCRRMLPKGSLRESIHGCARRMIKALNAFRGSLSGEVLSPTTLNQALVTCSADFFAGLPR